MSKNIGIFDTKGKNKNPLTDQEYSDKYKELANKWSKLPAYKHGEDIVKKIKKNDVILLASGTGSGKTVLIPKFALHSTDYKGKIIITLPKKIITKKAAEYAALTLDVELGNQIGYQFKGEHKKSENTNLLYSTDGSIVSMFIKDPLLESYDIIIIDEAHERKIQIDLLLYLIKNAIKLRKEQNKTPLKLIIMSATINENIFKDYYKDFKFSYMFLEGEPNFPIKKIFTKLTSNYLKEGIDIIHKIIEKINNNIEPNGDILFFVTSIKECFEVAETLTSQLKDAFIMPLYSGFDSNMEEYITKDDKYKELDKNYQRRIFISTNVAESSLTINNIGYVIDSGLEITTKYDPEKQVEILYKHLISKAQITQRIGRTGRTRKGTAYLLYSEDDFNKTEDFPQSEIMKVNISEICLGMLKLGKDLHKNFTIINAKELINNFIEVPQKIFIDDAFNFIKKSNLLDDNKNINQLGIDILASKLEIMEGLTLAKAMEINNTVFKKVLIIIFITKELKRNIYDLFKNYKNNQNKCDEFIRSLKNSYGSDHLLLLDIYNHFIENPKNDILDEIELNNIKKQYNRNKNTLFKLFSKYKKGLKQETEETTEINLESDNDDTIEQEGGNIIEETEIDTDTKIDNLETKILQSFSFGYESHIAYLRNENERESKYYFNDLKCDIQNWINKDLTQNKIIFRTNMEYHNKLKLNIISPFTKYE